MTKTLKQEIQNLYDIANIDGDTLDIFSLSIRKLILEIMINNKQVIKK